MFFTRFIEMSGGRETDFFIKALPVMSGVDASWRLVTPLAAYAIESKGRRNRPMVEIASDKRPSGN
jgi:hypothetical protein